MRSFLFLGCALALAAGGCSRTEEARAPEAATVPPPAAPGQADAPAPPPGGFGPLGDQSLDQMLELTRASFARMDRDGDGRVTEAEREAMRAQRGAAGPVGGPGRGGGMMARADADGDGQLTLAEMEAQARTRFERMDVDKDGVVTADERRAAFERRRSGG